MALGTYFVDILANLMPFTAYFNRNTYSFYNGIHFKELFSSKLKVSKPESGRGISCEGILCTKMHLLFLFDSVMHFQMVFVLIPLMLLTLLKRLYVLHFLILLKPHMIIK